jgi:transposase
VSVHAAPVTSSTVVVAVDVGKVSVALSVTDAARRRLLGPVEFAMTRSALTAAVGQVWGVVSCPQVPVKVGVEACGHYHQPLLTASAWPAGWEVLELNPGHVAQQRRVQGRRRVKTDAFDLDAITEMLLAGHGIPVTVRTQVLGQLRAWTAHRTRRVATRTATKNQLLGQLDRAFPGLTLALPDVLGTKAGRLVATEFADPARLAALGPARFVRFADARGVRVARPLAERLVAAARDTLPTADAVVARRVLAADLRLLHELEREITATGQELAVLLPDSPFATLTTVPGWGVVRAANYAGALGEPDRWPGPRQIYRASGLSPAQYESPRAAPGRVDQPGGQRRTASCPDRSRCRAVAVRPTRQGLRRRAEGPRQEGRDHRLRLGAPRHPNRQRPGPRPTTLRPRPLGLSTPGLSSTAALNAGRVGAVNVQRPQPAFCAGEDERR